MKKSAIISFALMLAACGNNTTNNEPAQDVTPDVPDVTPDIRDVMPDRTDSDMDVDMDVTGDMKDMEADEMSCEPITECPAEACGQIDDTCGGTVDCQPCDCVNGEPAQPTCGTCGLGTPSCDGSGVLSCEEPEFPEGQDLACERILYVDAKAIGGLEKGSPQEPYSTIGQALTHAKMEQAGQSLHWLVVLSDEPLNHSGILTIPDGVSILGGYSRQWERPVIAGRTRIMAGGDLNDSWVPADRQGDNVGVLFHENQQPTLIANVQLENQRDAPEAPGQHSVGVLVSSSKFVNFRNVEIKPLNGIDGANGINGIDGVVGVKGNDADLIIEDGIIPSPGVNTFVVADCPLTKGGDGGAGGTGGGFDTLGERGQRGASYDMTLAADGGARGSSPSDYQGQNGEPGVNGPDGANPSIVPSSLTPFVYMNKNATPYFDFTSAYGNSGNNGTDGGGGGGGGGGFVRSTSPLIYGGAGGAGGYGGCAGEGATPGQSGGSSVALVLIKSTDINLVSSELQAQKGGDGGDNALGGSLALGGGSGIGSRSSWRNPSSYGGLGGQGGNGGKGSNSTPGLGGHSIAAACSDDSVLNFDYSDTSLNPSAFDAEGGRYVHPVDGHPVTSASGAKIIEQGCVTANGI